MSLSASSSTRHLPTLSKSLSDSRFLNTKHLDHLNLTFYQKSTPAAKNGLQKKVVGFSGSQKNFKLFNTRKLKRRCNSENENSVNFFRKYLRQSQNKVQGKSSGVLGDVTQIKLTPCTPKLNRNRRGVLVKKNSISLDCLCNNKTKLAEQNSIVYPTTIIERQNDCEDIILHVPHRKNVRSHSTTGLKIEVSSKKWIKEIGSKAHLKIKKNIECLLNKETHYETGDASFFSRSMHFLNKDSIIIKKQNLKQNEKKDYATKESTRKEFLSAPKTRRVRSNSPLIQNNQPNNFLTITNHHNHQKSTSDKSSMRSCGSTNSTFSAGFLPSPEMNSPSATSLFNGYDSQTTSKNSNTSENHKKDTFTNEQHEQLKKKLINEQRRLSLKSKFHKTIPVKITVQGDDESSNETDKSNEQKLSLNDENSRNENLIKTSSSNNAEIAEENEQVRELKKKSEIEKESKIKSIQELGVSKNNSVVGSKPGQEVLTLISTWIKNAPNDFMGIRTCFFSHNFRKNNEFRLKFSIKCQKILDI